MTTTALTAHIVSFKCVLKNRLGHLISSSMNKDVLTVPPHEHATLRGLARGLQDIKKGEKRSISVHAEEAYGLYDPKKVILMPRSRIPDSIRLAVGQTVKIMSKSNQLRSYRVIQVFGDMVSLDGNHPLAGQDLVFEVEAVSVREATADELSDAQNPMANQQLLH